MLDFSSSIYFVGTSAVLKSCSYLSIKWKKKNSLQLRNFQNGTKRRQKRTMYERLSNPKETDLF